MRARTLWALAWRESRFARRRLFLFLSSISLGVAALVAVQGFSRGIERGVADQARALLGADLALASRQPFGRGTTALLDSLPRAGVPIARATSLASMALAPRTGRTRLAQLRAVEPGFPFYGQIETDPAGRWPELQAGRHAVADPALLVALGAQVGDSLAVGDARFLVIAALQKVPGDVEIASSFAPRLYLPARHLAATGLVQFGSRVDYEAFVRLPAPGAAAAFAREHAALFRAERVRSRTADEQQQSLTEALTRLGDYLGLIGVFALLLGGIGVASAMGAYMAQKADTVAVLRCLGASAPQVFGIYLAQAAAMGLLGALVGAGLGLAVQGVLPRLLADLLPVEVRLGVEPGALLAGAGVGVWVAVAFALLPLLATRRVSPLLALRRRVEPLRVPRRDGWRGAAWAALAASVLALAVWQAGSLRVGAAFALGIALTLAVLALVSRGIVAGVRRLPTRRLPYLLRQGLANLYRPGNQTPTVVLALGFGVFLLATLYLTQHNLLRPLLPGGAGARANLLFWDVQADQQAGIRELLRARGHALRQQAPIVPMRIARVNGRDVRALATGLEGLDADTALEMPERRTGPGTRDAGEPERWAVRREYRSTYRDTLVASERLLQGEWWSGRGRRGAGVGAVFPVSLERDIARDLAVAIGDSITWDVQGVELRTVVASTRAVDWARFEPNFFAVFPSAALADAPQTWVLLADVPSAAARATLQRDVVERFPNVAVVDLTQVQQALDAVLGRVSTAIRFLALFSIATGFIVLLGAVATGRLQRIRDSVLLRTLGATWRQVGAILLVEYLLLGALAVLAGAGLALGAGWALAHWLFRVDFAVPWAPLAALALAVTALAAGVGLLASREVFGRTPLEVLREEG